MTPDKSALSGVNSFSPLISSLKKYGTASSQNGDTEFIQRNQKTKRKKAGEKAHKQACSPACRFLLVRFAHSSKLASSISSSTSAGSVCSNKLESFSEAINAKSSSFSDSVKSGLSCKNVRTFSRPCPNCES